VIKKLEQKGEKIHKHCIKLQEANMNTYRDKLGLTLHPEPEKSICLNKS